MMGVARRSVGQGLNPTWEEFCGRDTAYRDSMRAVLGHNFGTGEDGNDMELYFCISEKDPEGNVRFVS